MHKKGDNINLENYQPVKSLIQGIYPIYNLENGKEDGA